MIIQVRGTSGSGKTTVVREIMKQLGNAVPNFIAGRKQPLYYQFGTVIVLGHYEVACGGCDTIGSVPQVFEALGKLPEHSHIVCEGLLLSEDVKWSVACEEEVRALFLVTDGETCLKRVGLRQQAKGKTPKDPARVRRKLLTRIGTIERARIRLIEAGIYCRRASADQAVSIILNWIKE